MPVEAEACACLVLRIAHGVWFFTLAVISFLAPTLCAVAVAMQDAVRKFRSGIPPVPTIAMQGKHRPMDT